MVIAVNKGSPLSYRLKSFTIKTSSINDVATMTSDRKSVSIGLVAFQNDSFFFRKAFTISIVERNNVNEKA